jgi:hypothetical protein
LSHKDDAEDLQRQIDRAQLEQPELFAPAPTPEVIPEEINAPFGYLVEKVQQWAMVGEGLPNAYNPGEMFWPVKTGFAITRRPRTALEQEQGLTEVTKHIEPPLPTGGRDADPTASESWETRAQWRNRIVAYGSNGNMPDTRIASTHPRRTSGGPELNHDGRSYPIIQGRRNT